MFTVELKKREEIRINRGHPWVYANEVAGIEGEGKNGDEALVYDSKGRYLGKGFINHVSKILVRILTGDKRPLDEEFFTEKITLAKKYREALGYDNNYRAVFSESDGLSGLIVDKYGDFLCVQFLSLGMDRRKDMIVSALVKVFEPAGIYERSDVAARKKEGLPLVKGPLYGEFDPRTVIIENGVKMTVDMENGQKTGYFLDQKENRFAIRRYVKNAEVLDCFCNVGGFSINAAAAGAKKVTALDISEKALEDVRENAMLNGFENVVTTLQGDVFEVLRQFKAEKRKFDVVILDPPAFCKNAGEVKDACRGYKDINTLAMKTVKPGGFLITASCSHYMTGTLFEKMLSDSAFESRRKVRIVETKVQSPDHPPLMGTDESSYLKFYVLNII